MRSVFIARLLAFSFAVVACATAHAQIKVELVMDQGQFLPGEELLIGVRIVNQSGRTLNFGTNGEWLRFSVTYHLETAVDQILELSQKPPFILATSKQATRVENLAACYNLNPPGHYKVMAIVNIPDWPQTLTSPQKSFDVVPGVRLWERVVGLPPSAAVPGWPESLKYLLIKKESRLYVGLRDIGETKTYRMCELSPIVSFGEPEAEVDKDGQLHTLNQAGARSFMYHVLNPKCELVKRMTYDYADTRPGLRPDGDGGYRVAGGRRRITANDYPTNQIPPTIKVLTPNPSTETAKKKKKTEKK